MSAALRSFVIERAHHRCEYCRMRQDHQPLARFHIEHIIARQHGGSDSPDNLALACHRYNLHKGPNLGGLDPETQELTRLFHPRQDRWIEHFALHDARIIGLTPVGRTTAVLLQMNIAERIELRGEMLAAGLW